MGSLFGSSDKSTGTNVNTPYQQDYYDKLLGSASNWLESGGMGQSQSYVKDLEGILGTMGQQYHNLATGAGKEERYNALQDLNQASADQANSALGGALSNIGLSSSASGGSMGSRRGVAEGVATANAQQNLAAQQAAQNQQFLLNEQKLQKQGLAGLGNVYSGVGKLHALAQGETSGAKELENLMAFQNLISGNMGGTSTGSAPTQDNTMQNIAGIASIAASIFSDEKLKKKVKKVKTKNGKKVKTKDGIDVVDWEWNKKGEKLGLKGKARGVLAQEAEKKRPDAVVEDTATGYKKVNYGAIM